MKLLGIIFLVVIVGAVVCTFLDAIITAIYLHWHPEKKFRVSKYADGSYQIERRTSILFNEWSHAVRVRTRTGELLDYPSSESYDPYTYSNRFSTEQEALDMIQKYFDHLDQEKVDEKKRTKRFERVQVGSKYEVSREDVEQNLLRELIAASQREDVELENLILDKLEALKS